MLIDLHVVQGMNILIQAFNTLLAGWHLYRLTARLECVNRVQTELNSNRQLISSQNELNKWWQACRKQITVCFQCGL